MNWIDKYVEKGARRVAQRASRRSLLTRLGTMLVGMAAVPLLPVARAQGESDQPPPDPGDPLTCDYWRNCAIDGFLCGCCGGSTTSCPPGTEMSSVTWIGTCRNPADGKDYIISYNDCCGKTSCGNCMCNRNERDRPIYRQFSANDINWCVGTSNSTYHCTVTLILGVST